MMQLTSFVETAIYIYIYMYTHTHTHTRIRYHILADGNFPGNHLEGFTYHVPVNSDENVKFPFKWICKS